MSKYIIFPSIEHDGPIQITDKTTGQMVTLTPDQALAVPQLLEAAKSLADGNTLAIEKLRAAIAQVEGGSQ